MWAYNCLVTFCKLVRDRPIFRTVFKILTLLGLVTTEPVSQIFPYFLDIQLYAQFVIIRNNS